MTPRTILPFIAGAFGLSLLTACGSITVEFGEDRIDGSGDVVTETLDLTGFTAIDIQDTFDVDVTVGDDFSVVIDTDDNLVERLDVDVDGDELQVRLDGGVSLGEGTLKATIVLPELVDIDVSGASTVSITGVSGATLEADVSGASELTMKGEVTELMVDVSGASELVSDLVDVSIAKVDLSGASDVRLASADTVTGDLSGASTLTIPSGSTSRVETSGASSVVQR